MYLPPQWSLEQVHHSESSLMPFCIQSLTPPHPGQSLICFLITKVFIFLEFYISVMILFIVFCVWYILIKKWWCWHFIHVVALISSIKYTTISLDSPVGRHLGCFQIWVVMNSATVWTLVCKSLQTYVCIFLGWISTSGIAGSYAKCVLNFLKNCQVFPK